MGSEITVRFGEEGDDRGGNEDEEGAMGELTFVVYCARRPQGREPQPSEMRWPPPGPELRALECHRGRPLPGGLRLER